VSGPLIEAEVALVDAETRVLFAEGPATDLDWRRLCRAERRVMRELAALLASQAGVGNLDSLAERQAA
jgi:hypothetical protein